MSPNPRLLIALCFALALLPGRVLGESARSRYIVHLESPAVAVFEGFGPEAPASKRALLPTRPAASGRPKLDLAAPEVAAYRKFLADERRDFTDAAERRLGRPLKSAAALDLVLNALVLDLSPEEAATLAKQEGVARIEPEFVRRLQTDAGPRWVGAPAVWSGAAGLPTRGAGVVIGVIDSGINVDHPSFAGLGPIDGHRHVPSRTLSGPLCASATSAPCNGKLIGLRDFTSGASSAEPDNGLDFDGHGSHVAAIAAGNLIQVELQVGGNAVRRELSGVAPHAHLVSYKACEVEAECQGSWLLAAINAAVADGVDVLNYSIGGDPRDPWTSSDALALLAAREAGVVPVVAAGNEGPTGGSVTAPGNAPWVISVASVSHDRAVGGRLLDFEGGDAAVPAEGSLLGASATLGYGPARVVIPQDHPGCGVGEGLGLGADGRPDGSSNPWAGNPARFNGEIVVCLRGTQARLAKSDNVLRAGAGGMILINGPGDGETVMADGHALPSLHLGLRDSNTLMAWLAAGGQRARIEGARLIEDPTLGGRLSATSGRGPISYGGVMLPSIAAPGIGILSAGATGEAILNQSGTSMAAPHVAGAAALLRALHPQWTVDHLQSALMGSARTGLIGEDGQRAASANEVGAGGLDVAAAARVGLALEVPAGAFRAARPAQGGQPRELNLPGLLHENCLERCSLTRELRDLAGGGRWRVRAELADGSVRVTPSEFELGAGARQRLQVEIDLTGAGQLGRWLQGSLWIEPAEANSHAGLRLPLSIFASSGTVPARLSARLPADAGLASIGLSGLVALQGFSALAGAPSPLQRLDAGLAAAPGSSAFEGAGDSVRFGLLELPAADAEGPVEFLLASELVQGSDVELRVGIDYSGDGLPQAGEQLCSASGSGARCDLPLLQSGSRQRVWVLARNRANAPRSVQLKYALLDPRAAQPSPLTVTAPSQLDRGEAFALRLAVDAPDWLAEEQRMFLLQLVARPGAAPFARIPVELSRAPGRAARALTPGSTLRLRLRPQERHDGVYIDLPQGAAQLDIGYRSSQAGSFGFSVGALPGVAMGTANPVALPAPREGVSRFGQLPPSRLRLNLQNQGDQIAEIELELLDLRLADVEFSSPPPGALSLRNGAWYDPSRSGSGLYLYSFGDQWGLLWYTYLEDGTPTWYSGSAPKQQSGAIRIPLLRSTWDGSRAQQVQVGEARLTALGEERLHLGYSLEGVSGSQLLQWIGLPGCPSVNRSLIDTDGLWYDAARPGFGYSFDASADTEVVSLFLYDRRGWPRWVLGSGQPFAAAPIVLQQFSGSCPNCSRTSAQATPVGLLSTLYGVDGPQRVEVQLAFAPPLDGLWERSHAMSRLSLPQGCAR